MSTSAKSSFRSSQRLKKQEEYKALFDSPDYRVSDKAFLLLAKKNRLAQGRLGVVVGKAKLKRAVDRNRCKRQMRESFRLHQHQLAGLDTLLLLKQPSPEIQTGQRLRELGVLWARLLAKVGQD